jgi:ABC-type transport system involved in cytochrome bd biosynthesis fused ATPase/permease subunit
MVTHGRGAAATTAPVVEARNVRRMYSDDQGGRALDLTVPVGVIFGLVGPSGSGKTTTVRLLLGTEAPQQGAVTVLGHPPAGFSRGDRASIGYLPQAPALAGTAFLDPGAGLSSEKPRRACGSSGDDHGFRAERPAQTGDR